MTAAASQVHGSPSRPGRPAIGLPLPLRIDARRPASWIALAMAAVGGGAAGELDSGQQAVAWMIGTLATVAAIGDLPLTLCDGGIARMRGRRLAWMCARAAWPIASWSR